MTIREYIKAVACYIDLNFEPMGDNPEKDEQFKRDIEDICCEYLPQYYDGNIEPSIAAEFLAQKYEMIRLPNKRN